MLTKKTKNINMFKTRQEQSLAIEKLFEQWPVESCTSAWQAAFAAKGKQLVGAGAAGKVYKDYLALGNNNDIAVILKEIVLGRSIDDSLLDPYAVNLADPVT